MKKLVCICLLVAVSGWGQANLVLNGEFDDGGTSWTNNASSIYYYTDAGDTIASWYGWWQRGIWQNTSAVFQADTEYTMTVVARKGGPGTAGAILSIIDVDNGWNHLIDTTIDFQLETYGEGAPWEVLTATFNTADDPSVVGHSIGVGLNIHHDTNDWIHVDSVTLVPEPASLGILGLGALLSLRKRR